MKRKRRKYNKYKATLIGKDGFSKVMIIKKPCPMLFIPKQEELNVYLGNPPLYPDPPAVERKFVLSHAYKNKLTYKEI